MCHSRHTRSLETAPQRETAPARDPALRASDAERESIVSQLREHGAAGRLDVEELEQRVETAYSARTHGELGALVRDLPAAPAPRRVVASNSGRGHGRHGHGWHSFFAVNALLVAIWALDGGGEFWPAWVMAWWAFALVMKSGPQLLRLR